MTYINQVNESLGGNYRSAPVPTDVLAFALELKQPKALATRATPDSLQSLSAEALRYEKARIVGGESVRLAIASHIASRRNDAIISLYDSEPSVREEILTSMEQSDQRLHFSDEEVRRQLFKGRRAAMSPASRLAVLASYANFVPGSYHEAPTHMSGFGGNDALFVQAFGRNMFEDKDLTSEIVEKRQVLGSDEAMFAHLDTRGFDEGASNRALADTSVALLTNPQSIIEHAWQWEVAYSVWKQYPELYRVHQIAIHVLWPHSNFYPTYEVKADSMAVARERGLYNPLELAHPDMLVRGETILKKLGVVADPVFADIPFDADSAQAQTRNSKEWVKREALTRVHHVVTNHVRF